MGATSSFAWRPCLILLALAATACGSSQVQFQIQRPAAINVREYAGDDDASVSVAEWETGEEEWTAFAKEIDSNLRDIIGNNKVVTLVDEDGAVTLRAKLTDHRFEDNVTDEQQTCSKAVGKQVQQYACTAYTRKGRAFVRVALDAVDRDGNTILTRTESCEADSDKPPEVDPDVAKALGSIMGGVLQGVTAGVANADNVGTLAGAALGDGEQGLGEPIEPFPSYAPTTAVDGDPAKIDWEGVLRVCRKRMARQLAKLVVPYKETVSKPWLSCGDGSDECDAALVQLQAGNHDRAKTLLEKALAKVNGSDDGAAKAGVHWGLALVHTGMADFKQARKHVDACIEIDPGDEVFAKELKELARREKEHGDLMAQGASDDDDEPKKKRKKKKKKKSESDDDDDDDDDGDEPKKKKKKKKSESDDDDDDEPKKRKSDSDDDDDDEPKKKKKKKSESDDDDDA